MAASDYYQTGHSYPPSYHSQPPSHYEYNPTSDPYSHSQPSQTSYSNTSYQPHLGRSESGNSDDAVPLRPYNKSRDSQASNAPIIPPKDDDDFVRDAKPGRGRRPQRESFRPPEDQGWFRGRITWCCYIFSLIQIAVFIAELAKMGSLTGSPIQTKPSINPMIGPSPYVLINMGARYQPCMHRMANVNNTISWPCPDTTTSDAANSNCTLAQLCGFNSLDVPEVYGEPDQPAPNQWFRFIVPIFLHAGIIHIGFNLLLQLTLGRDMEIAIGSLRFCLVYISAGIFGFVLGGNFAANGIASTGASGSLFGILALNLLDLLYHWQTRRSPGKELAFIFLDIGIAFVLGLLPGLDNFSHIGGFLMGLVLGVCLLRSPAALSQRLGEDDPMYGPARGASPPLGGGRGRTSFVRGPLGFFKGRKAFWWAWWLVRAAALLGTIVGFIVLLKNFYVWGRTCSWCKYLTCIHIKNWCDIGNLEITTSPNTKRDAMAMAEEVFRNAFVI